MYVGDMVTLNLDDFNLSSKNGKWLPSSNDSANYAISSDGKILTITAVKAGYADAFLLLSNGFSDSLGVNFSIYEKPSSTKANFRINTDKDRTYYIKSTGNEDIDYIAGSMPKGQTYDPTKVVFNAYPTNQYMTGDTLRIYPDSSANIPSNRISPEGYLTGDVRDYYTYTTTSDLIYKGSTGLIGVGEKKEGICTMTVIENTTGRSCKIDFKVKVVD